MSSNKPMFEFDDHEPAAERGAALAVETAGKRDGGSCKELGAATEHPACGAELTEGY